MRSLYSAICHRLPSCRFAARTDRVHSAAMNVTVNGDARELPDGQTVRALVAGHGLDPAKVAVELNRRLLRSERYDEPLKDGDEVEIVTFVGGG
jgi:sulfur carrier protein